MKTIERAHMPNKLWERVKLPRNYEKALEIIDKHLQYWPKLLVHKIKQRLTKMTQYRIRMRKLALKVREKVITAPRKEKKREARREEKAEKAAVLEKSIEKELLERLKKGVYGDIYNYPVKQYENVLDMEATGEEEEEEEEEEPEIEYVEGYEELEEDEDMEDFAGLLKDVSSKDNDGFNENDEIDPSEEPISRKRLKDYGPEPGKLNDDGRRAKSKRKGKVTIEFEEDEDTGNQQFAHV